MQKTLFDKRDKWSKRADQWIVENPAAFRKFIVIARSYRRRGRKVGAKRIMEQLRWDMEQSGGDQGGFKVNNNYTAQIARRAVEFDSRLKDVFVFRDHKGQVKQ